jgi:DNA repair ATPase RecN
MSQQEYVQLEAVRNALKQVVKDKSAIDEVLDLLSAATVSVDETKPEALNESESAETESEGEDLPKVKQQFVIVVSDPKKVITEDLTGWIVQIPDSESVLTVTDRIKKAAYNYNASKKGQKYPIKTIGEAVESIGNKFFKPYDLKVKTKEAVFVVVTDNVLPKG